SDHPSRIKYCERFSPTGRYRISRRRLFFSMDFLKSRLLGNCRPANNLKRQSTNFSKGVYMNMVRISILTLAMALSLTCSENKPIPNNGKQSILPLSTTAPATGDQIKVDEYPMPVNQVQPKYP